MIEALTFASGYFSKTFSCTARAPLSRHMGHVGESKAKNRILPRSLLNRSLSDSRESSRTIISAACLPSFIPKIPSIDPPPGGYRPNIISLWGSWLCIDNCQTSFPAGCVPLSLTGHFSNSPDECHRPSTRNSSKLVSSQSLSLMQVCGMDSIFIFI
jgi:hypothetical protein